MRRPERRSTAELIDTALDSAQPDERRKAIDALVAGDDAGNDLVLKALDAIARTDADGMVRVSAVRGLAKAGTAPATTTLVNILRSADEKLPNVLPAGAPVRWEAAQAVEMLAADGRISAEQRGPMLDALLARAERDADRNVRLCCLGALGEFPDRRVPPVLIKALREHDFAARRRAERSLQHLTGQSYDHDADAWEAWLASSSDPFSHQGSTG